MKRGASLDARGNVKSMPEKFLDLASQESICNRSVREPTLKCSPRTNHAGSSCPSSANIQHRCRWALFRSLQSWRHLPRTCLGVLLIGAVFLAWRFTSSLHWKAELWKLVNFPPEKQAHSQAIVRRHPRLDPTPYFPEEEKPEKISTHQCFDTKSCLESDIVPYWIQYGGSISFGKFTNGGGARFLWTKDGTALTAVATSFYSVRNVSFKDGGFYQCVMHNQSETRLWAETFLQVSKPPVVKNKFIWQELQVNETLALRVHLKTQGTPSPEFQWRHNGQPIPGSLGSSRNYVVSKVQQQDEGTYTCEVYNVAGSMLWEEAVVVVTSKEQL